MFLIELFLHYGFPPCDLGTGQVQYFPQDLQNLSVVNHYHNICSVKPSDHKQTRCTLNVQRRTLSQSRNHKHFLKDVFFVSFKCLCAQKAVSESSMQLLNVLFCALSLLQMCFSGCLDESQPQLNLSGDANECKWEKMTNVIPTVNLAFSGFSIPFGFSLMYHVRCPLLIFFLNLHSCVLLTSLLWLQQQLLISKQKVSTGKMKS